MESYPRENENRPQINEINADKEMVYGRGTWVCPARRGRTAKPPAFSKGEGGYGTYACLHLPLPC
ncbi:MAG: hypothetical protein H6Q00_782 [Holophagaceae bacterium]|nr:hypothetical protein [Holophagaceae bacterium]